MLEVHNVFFIPLIIGVVEVFKSIGLKKKFVPLLSLCVGILIGVFYIYPEDIKSGAIVGMMYGLSASGLYSGTKNSIERDQLP